MGSCVSSCITTEVEYPGIDDTTVRRLQTCTYENTPEYDLKNVRGWCKVVDVYDGDTVHIAMMIGNEIKRIKCRLDGIDAAEIKSIDPLEKAHAERSRDELKGLLMDGDKLVWVHIIKPDKFGGRYDAGFYRSEQENSTTYINGLMVDKGYAYEYTGKTKKKEFKRWYKS
jgi:endonuclease YncB( thermonuclease family)